MASKTGTELFLVDNSDADWKVLRYLHDWCQLAKGLDIATGYFEIGSLLALKDEWQKVDQIRLLMGAEVSQRTKAMFEKGLQDIRDRLDGSIETEKQRNDFLTGVPAIVEAIRHTDLLRGGDFQYRLDRVKEMADVVVIDEAHHFRNPGVKGEPGDIRRHGRTP